VNITKVKIIYDCKVCGLVQFVRKNLVISQFYAQTARSGSVSDVVV